MRPKCSYTELPALALDLSKALDDYSVRRRSALPHCRAVHTCYVPTTRACTQACTELPSGGTSTLRFSPQCIVQVSGKRVLVVCSVLPWVEAIMLEREAKVWTTGFNGVAPIWNGTSTNPVTIIAPAELMRIATETKGTLDNGAHPDEKRFDALVCLGCVQHAGLGAYGEPIDPNGDVAMMKEMHSWTRPGGRLFLSLPTGDSDTIFFIKHRIYGKEGCAQGHHACSRLDRAALCGGRKAQSRRRGWQGRIKSWCRCGSNPGADVGRRAFRSAADRRTSRGRPLPAHLLVAAATVRAGE